MINIYNIGGKTLYRLQVLGMNDDLCRFSSSYDSSISNSDRRVSQRLGIGNRFDIFELNNHLPIYVIVGLRCEIF